MVEKFTNEIEKTHVSMCLCAGINLTEIIIIIMSLNRHQWQHKQNYVM